MQKDGGTIISEKLEFITVTSLGAQHAFTTRNGGSSQMPYESLNLSMNTCDLGASVKRNRGRVLGQFGAKNNEKGLPKYQSHIIYECAEQWVAAGNLNCDGIIKHFLSIYGGYNAENY